MQTKRFVAADMRRALTLVREELGEDAMILSTHRTSKGVEIVATSDEKLELNTNTPISAEVPIAPTAPTPTSSLQSSAMTQPQGHTNRGLASGKTQEELALELEMARQRMMAVKKEEKMTLGEWAERDQQSTNIKTPPMGQNASQQYGSPQGQTAAPLSHGQYTAPAQQTNNDPGAVANHEKENEEIRRLQNEIASMRDLFETQLASIADIAEGQERRYQDQQIISEVMPVITDVKKRLKDLGLTQACNDQIIRSLKSFDDGSMSTENLWAESLARLARNIPAIHTDPVATGGIYAFLGTTGVGKTTTIAKLAARYVIEHGPQDVVLLTTDTFRIAAHDQLRSLGRILNVQVKIVDDLKQLPKILASYSRQALVLIDTPGMSYNDPLLKQHLMALRQCRHVQNALVLSANSQYQMMQASIHSYRIAKPRFCIMTKLDECASLGDAISLLAANNLPLAYVTNGQAVPADLAVMKPHQLVSKAVKLSHDAVSLEAQPQQSV